MANPTRLLVLLLALGACGDDLSPCPEGSCSGHGSCSMSTGSPACACASGYAGAACDGCAASHQDNDGDGVCAPTCAFAALTCGAHAGCSDDTGAAVCGCLAGYGGAACDECVAPHVPGAEGTCVLPDGSTCAGPLRLDLTAPSVNGTTTGKGDDLAGACAVGGGAPDVVYTFTIVTAITVTFTTTGFDTVVYLRTACADVGSEIACNDDGSAGTGSEISATLGAGTYYLIVDGYGSAAGAYVLGVTVSCPAGLIYDPAAGCVDDPCDPNPCVVDHRTLCAPVSGAAACSCDPGYVDDPGSPGACIVDPEASGEGCSDPLVLPGASGTIAGDNGGASDDGKGTCGGEGPDTVYAFTVTERSLATFLMEGAGYDTALHLRRACADLVTEVACNDDHVGYSAGMTLVLEPGAYFLFADSWSAGAAFTLTYSLFPDPCADDPCPGTPTCLGAADFSTYTCVCPAGSIPDGESCLDDPCLPNPCAVEHRTRCAPVLPASHTCSCNLGYIDDGAGGCVVDPDANDWAFLVYLNADNDLEEYGYGDLEEMKLAGSTANVHIIVLFDTQTGDGGAARKLRVTPGGVEILEEMGEIDMGDWHTLADFGVWATETFPARHYALILWDHGDGWRKPGGAKAFSIDATDGGQISVAGGDYAAALAEITAALGAPLDIVGFDACLMGMWEIAEATAGYANLVVASEETIPGTGWPYDDILLPLVAAPDQDPVTLGRTIVDAYADDMTDNSTLSLLDLGALPPFDLALGAFADALGAHADVYDKVETARDDAQSFADWDNRDLVGFVENVQAMPGAPADIVAAGTALLARSAEVVLWNRAQADYSGAHGLAIYLPARGHGPDASYVSGAGAVWTARATWDEFLATW